MGAYVAMLRGVNVGGKNKIKMPDLQALFVALGHQDVVTYIQSGNVVFKGPAAQASAIEKRIKRDLGLDIAVVLRTKAELAKVIAANPFVRAGADLAKLHVTFLAEKADADLVYRLERHCSPTEEFDVRGREVYLHCPDGLGRTKLTNAFQVRRPEITATTRNWNTVNKLLELADR